MNKLAALSAFLVLMECLFWGLGNVLINVTLQTMPTILCLGIRSAIATFLFFCVFRTRIKQTVKKSHILPCIAIGAVSTASFLTAMLALKYSTATTAGFLISLSVVFTPFFAFFILRTKIDVIILIPIAVIIIGLYYLCGGNIDFTFGFGETIGVICSAFYGLLLTLSKKYLEGIDTTVVSVFQTGFAAVSCLILGFLLEDYTLLMNLPVFNWLSVIFLAVFASFAAFLFQNFALKNLSSVYVSMLFCTESVFSALFAFIIIGERLTIAEAIGAFTVLLGIITASVMSERKKEFKQ
ncbi:MAG: DMT family transporter [Ruminococcaceae bacterium]|nr:DMT family transporter [Oscillospiraceae bacterium]